MRSALVLLLAVALTVVTEAALTARVVIVANLGGGTTATPLPAGAYLEDRAGWAAQMETSVGNMVQVLAATYPKVSFASPDIVNSQGDPAEAVAQLMGRFNNTAAPTAVVVADVFEVGQAIKDLMGRRFGAGSLFINAVSLPHPRWDNHGGRSLHMAPTDTDAAAAMVQFMKAASWSAFSLLIDPVVDGELFTGALEIHLRMQTVAKATVPRQLAVETLAPWTSTGRDAADVELIRRLALVGVPGVVVAGGDRTAARILSAAARARAQYGASIPALRELYFLFGPVAAAAFPTMPATALANNAIVAPRSTHKVSFNTNILAPTAAVTDAFTVVLSAVCDCLSTVAGAVTAANNATDPTAVFNAAVGVSITGGMTGPIVFTSKGYRLNGGLDVLVRSQTTTTLLASYRSGKTTVNENIGLGAIVPKSLLRRVATCVIAPRNCGDVSSVRNALLVLLDANAAAQTSRADALLPSGVSLTARPISTDNSAIDAMSAISRDPTCDLVIGPGRTNLAVALNPLVKYWKLATLDFGATSTELASNITFPFYSRTVPSDDSMVSAVAAVCKEFGWHVMTIITTRDVYGSAMVERFNLALGALSYRVEVPQFISEDADNATLIAALTTVRDKHITRIVFVALPTGDAHVSMFFDVVTALGMHKTHIFLLSDSVCLYSDVFPARRAELLGSFCLVPQYDTAAFNARFNTLNAAHGTAADNLLAAGGFPSTCDRNHVSMYAPFASDAAVVGVTALSKLIGANNGSLRTEAGASIFNGVDVTAAVRAVKLSGATGIVDFDQHGDRQDATYVVNVQQWGKTVAFATWTKQLGLQRKALLAALVWPPSNSTDRPSSTIRSTTFIIETVAAENPGVIAVSVLGLLITIALLVFCVNHYRLHKQLAGLQINGPQDSTNLEMQPRPNAPPAPVPLADAPVGIAVHSDAPTASLSAAEGPKTVDPVSYA